MLDSRHGFAGLLYDPCDALYVDLNCLLDIQARSLQFTFGGMGGAKMMDFGIQSNSKWAENVILVHG